MKHFSASHSSNVKFISEPESLIRIRKMAELIGCSRTTLYRWVQEGRFPKPLMQGTRTIGWRKSQYDNWIEECTPK